MYAIIETGGKQFRVEEGTKILVDRMAADVNSEVSRHSGEGYRSLSPKCKEIPSWHIKKQAAVLVTVATVTHNAAA